MRQRQYIFALRFLHGLFALYFILCIVYIYYSAFTLKIDSVLGIAIISIFTEGFIVFVLNKGHCPLIHIQKKLKDPVPFFNLFLPDSLAKKAIPFFTGLTFLGILILILRMWIKSLCYLL